jgi:hypothetical protein
VIVFCLPEYAFFSIPEKGNACDHPIVRRMQALSNNKDQEP